MNERDVFWPNNSARVCKTDHAIREGKRIERGVRLYSTMYKQAWSLQIRSPLGIGSYGGGKDGKDDVVANVSLSRDDMKALRDQIDAFLAEGQ